MRSSRRSKDGNRHWLLIPYLIAAVLILGALTATAIVPCPERPSQGAVKVAIPGSRALRVLYVGDSLSAGLYASSEDKGFRQRVNTAFGKVHDVESQKVGATNYTASTVDLGTIGTGWDLAIVEQGTNDTGRSTPEEFRSDYGTLLDAIVKGSPGVQLLCVGVWTEPRFAKYYDRVIESECFSRGGTFRRLDDLFADPANRGPAGVARFGGISDDFHPNDLGHKQISARIVDAIALTGGPLPWYRSAFARLRGCEF